MNINAGRKEEEHFAIEDVLVSYSSIEISHVNDNRAPATVIIKKVAIWAAIVLAIATLFFL